MTSNVYLPPAPTGVDRPQVLARVYPGYHESAVELFQTDAAMLLDGGYVPVGQSYAEGRWATRFVALVLIASLFVIGLPFLAYMIVVRPPGSLGVTYVLRDRAPHA
jgi:hypothetical protein